jgi:HlyD family secretion protein
MEQIVKRPKPAAPADVEEALGLDANGEARPRRRRWAYVALAIAAALGTGAYLWFGQSEPVVRYATQAVERGNLVVEVSATGTLQPLTQVEISSELSGVVRSVTVEENQRVTQGQVLAELDTTRTAAQVERAEANVKAAAARVTDAGVTLKETEQAYQRAEQLAGRGMVANQALETAEAARDRAASAVETAEANLAVAEADLKLQQAELSKSTIHAPIDGIVLTRSVNPGQTVAASMQAPVLFVIAENLETMQLNAAIDEADIGAVETGQKARFTVDAFPARRFDAEISDISYASATTEGVVTYQAKLSVDNKALLLRPGMTATVNVVTREADGVLLAPSAAFRFTPQAQQQRSFSISDLFMPRFRGPGGPRGGGNVRRDGGRTVHVLENGEPVRRSVEVGATAGDMTEIVSGLSEGDRVVTGIARDGARSR